MQPIEIKAPVGPTGPARRQDVYALKAGLARIGEYRPRRGIGMTGELDRETIEGVKRVQRRNGLRVSETVRPDDGTIDVLNSEAAERGKLYRPAISSTFLRRLESDQPGAGAGARRFQGQAYRPLAVARPQTKTNSLPRPLVEGGGVNVGAAFGAPTPRPLGKAGRRATPRADAPGLLAAEERGAYTGLKQTPMSGARTGTAVTARSLARPMSGAEPLSGSTRRSKAAPGGNDRRSSTTPVGAISTLSGDGIGRPANLLDRDTSKPRPSLAKQGLARDLTSANPMIEPLGPPRGGGDAIGGVGLGLFIGTLIDDWFGGDTADPSRVEAIEEAKALGEMFPFLRPYLPNQDGGADEEDGTASPPAIKGPGQPSTGSPTGPEDPDPGGPGPRPPLPEPLKLPEDRRFDRVITVEELIGDLTPTEDRRPGLVNYRVNGTWQDAQEVFRQLGPTDVFQPLSPPDELLYVGKLDSPVFVNLRSYSSTRATGFSEITLEIHRHDGIRKVAIRFVDDDGLPVLGPLRDFAE